VLHLVRIFDDLIDEVAEMEDEAEAAVGRCALVLPNHPEQGILSAFIDALARDEGEAHRALVAWIRRRDGSTNAASAAFIVGKTVPVDGARPEAGGEHSAGPIGFGGDRRTSGGDRATEFWIECDFRSQLARLIPGEGAPCP